MGILLEKIKKSKEERQNVYKNRAEGEKSVYEDENKAQY